MILYFKVGTMSGKHYKVRYKRKPPKVGDIFEIVDPNERWAKPERVYCTEIRDVGGEMLYVVARL